MSFDVADTSLTHLYPPFAAKIKQVLEQVERETKDKFVNVAGWKVVETFRSQARQNWLYEQGRSRPGPVVTYKRGVSGNHPKGLAVDLYPHDHNGNVLWSPNDEVWTYLGHAARTFGLQWGGDYPKITHGTFVDKPHVEPPYWLSALWTLPALYYLHSLGLR